MMTTEPPEPTIAPAAPAAPLRPGPTPWALLVFEALQLAATAVYWLSGFAFMAATPIIILLWVAATIAAVVTLIWAVTLVRRRVRTIIPRLAATLAGIGVGVSLIALVFLLWLNAQLTV